MTAPIEVKEGRNSYLVPITSDFLRQKKSTE
jgi:hypothetical protein